MVKIRIYNYKNAREREKFRRCAMFFIERLMPRKKRLDVTITINPRLLKEEHMSGSCEPEDVPVNHKHYEFSIHIDETLNFADKLSILAHELTHVKQYSSGEMYSDARNPDITIWKGKRYNDTKVKYENQPWEKDAQAHEEKLLDEILATDIWK